MNFSSLKNNGWCEINASNLESLGDELVKLGKELGNPVAHRNLTGLVQRIIPTVSTEAYQKSLSSQYSLNSFPFHVDTAHWLTPCRYVILGCHSEGESNRETILMDFPKIDISRTERDMLLNAPFKICNGRNSFYGTVLSKQRDFIRYDPGCMTPATKHGYRVNDIFSKKSSKDTLKSIKWICGKILIIDNWRILHGRGKSINDGSDRVLYRVLVV